MPAQDPADRLDARMRRLGLSQAELGRQAGISGQNIGKVLNRRISLTVEMARKLAPHLGVTVAWLIGEDEPARSAEAEIPIHIIELGRWLDQLEPDIQNLILMLGTCLSIPAAQKRFREMLAERPLLSLGETRSQAPQKRGTVVPIKRAGRRRKTRKE